MTERRLCDMGGGLSPQQQVYELQRAGKPFEFMTYAKSRHAFADPLLTKHLQQLTLDFVLKSVDPEGAR